MSLKITIEVDGQSEQEIAPVLGRTTQQLIRTQPIAQENVAYLHQTIQQLQAQNQRLLAGMQARKEIAPAAQSERSPQSARRIPASQMAVVAPSMPARYRPNPWQIAQRQLRRSIVPAAQWLWAYKGWLLVFVLMSSAVYGTVLLAPKFADLVWPVSEYTDTAGNKPGETQTAPPTAAEAVPPANAPDAPASKAGSYPPPPPAFQSTD